jgi:putative DNA primase/helicase
MNAISTALEQLDNMQSITGARSLQVHKLTDLGNAERFVDAHKDRVRFLHDLKAWLIFDGAGWREDTDGQIVRLVAECAKDMLRHAADLPADEQVPAVKWALQSQAQARIEATIALAKTMQPIAATSGQFDEDDHLLAVANGTLDLKVGKFRESDPADMISNVLGVEYDPNADCPRFEQFLVEVFDGDRELVDWMQVFLGYLLTGETKEHVLAIWHGAGCNGKSVLTGVLAKLLGPLAVTADFSTFLRSRSDRGPRDDLARLRSARLVTATESGEGRKFDDATVKAITGGDTIVARALYSAHVEFRPRFKIVLATNYLPRVDGEDDAIWRRLRLIPFNVNFEGREDRDLPAKLEAELPGILNWALEGCVRWMRDGLPTTSAVVNATREYRSGEDLLGQFLEERCKFNPEARTATADLMETYVAFCDEAGERPLTKGRLTRRLTKRGVVSKTFNGTRCYLGIEVVA